MADRKNIGKKIRFEVFKRDKFTCQYCGNKAPDVVLNVDHIHPVVDGGDNSIINLITSCFGCNSGKGGRKIPDQSTLTLQREELERQQERLEQIEMMAEWRTFLQENIKKECESICNFVNEKIKPSSLSDKGKKIFEKLVKKYGLDKVFEATDISADQYLEITSDETKFSASIDKFINKIEGILICNSLPLIDQKIRHIRNIINKKYSKHGYVNLEDTIGIMNRYVTLLKSKGINDNQILKSLNDEVLVNVTLAKHNYIWEAFMENRIRELQEIKNLPPKIDKNNFGDQFLKGTKNEIIEDHDFYKEIRKFVDDQNGFVEATCHVLALVHNGKTLDINSITKEMVLEICLSYLIRIKNGFLFDDSYKAEFLKSFYNNLPKNKILIHCSENQYTWCENYLKFAMMGMLETFSESLFYFIKYVGSLKLNDNQIIFDFYCSLIDKNIRT